MLIKQLACFTAIACLLSISVLGCSTTSGKSDVTLVPGKYIVNGKVFADPFKAGEYLVSLKPAHIHVEACKEEDLNGAGRGNIMRLQLENYALQQFGSGNKYQYTSTTIPPGTLGCYGYEYWGRKPPGTPAAPADQTAQAAPGVLNDPYARGRVYEEQGKGDKELYSLALRDYILAAEVIGDARAYSALARMHASGLGTRVSTAEAKKWSDRLQEAYRQANAVCARKEATTLLQKMVAELDDRSNKGTAALNAITGADNRAGKLVIVRMGAYDFVNIKTQFSCLAKVARVNFRVDLNEPAFIAYQDDIGNEHIDDNSIAAAGARVAEGILESLAANANAVVDVYVLPSGGTFLFIEGGQGRPRTIVPTGKSQ